MKKLLTPQFLESTPLRIMVTIFVIQLLAVLYFFQFHTSEIAPKPFGIWISLMKILSEKTFVRDFFATLNLIFWGMGISIGVSLIVVYLSVIPFFKSVSLFFSKLRFLTYTALTFVFIIMVHNGHDLKISLLLFGIIPFFVTSLLSYINDIPKQEYELCYTLKFNRWQTLYEVVIRGKFHLVIEVIRQNFAIAWMMITSVEGLSMSEGGMGTMMIKSNKYMKIDDALAVLLVIFVLGIIFDYLFGVLRVWIFPYTNTKRHSKLWINRLVKLAIAQWNKFKSKRAAEKLQPVQQPAQ